jgi:lipopolysaccharide assembly protein B
MIELEPWVLLLVPLLFAAGWWLRGYDTKLRAADPADEQRVWLRGINHLLNEQPDQAIDAFVEVARLDPETVELHFALGNLFRRRGEIDRAIRIHSHLVNRADLSGASRAKALAGLAQDYLKGGMLDRAEEAFAKLADDPQHRVEALRALMRIFQMEREWPHAIDAARKLQRESGESHATQIAHFHCELAERAIERGDLAAARGELDAALVVDRRNVRAAILAGDLAQRSGESEAAIGHWQRIEANSPAHMPLVAARLADALDAAGRRSEALNTLRRNLLDHPSIDLLDVTLPRVSAWEGAEAADRLLRDELQRNPSLLGFERLLAAHAGTRPMDPQMEQLRSVISAQARKLARYRCKQCGFRSREFFWHCPGCSSWDSYPPRRIEELDDAG